MSCTVRASLFVMLRKKGGRGKGLLPEQFLDSTLKGFKNLKPRITTREHVVGF